MKNPAKLLLALVVLGAVAYWRLAPSSSDQKTVKVLSWSQYLPEEFLARFTAETGITVQVSYISSNEELFAKLKAGATGYDLMQPSDYMVERLIKLGLIAPLNPALLPNTVHLEEHLKDVPYDPGLKYSRPFLEGSTGLIVDTKKVSIPAEGLSWSALFEPQDPRNTYLLDDMREVFAAALLWKGRNPNLLDEDSVGIASQVLFQAKSRVASFTSEPLAVIQRSGVTVAHAYSYQAIEAQRSHPNLAYVLPKEGAITWVDTLVLSSHSKKTQEAHQLINYIMDPANAERLHGLNHLPGVLKKEVVKTEKFSPSDELKKRLPAEELKDRLFFRDLNNDSLLRMGKAWTELKTG